MLTVDLVGDSALHARLNSTSSRVRQRLKTEITRLALKLESHVKSNKLSGQVLHVVTGALRSGIFNEVLEEGEAIFGKVVAPRDVPYAAIHEFGGTIHHPARVHTTYHQIKGGELQYRFSRMSKAHIAIDHQGTAYQINMPERSYLRSSLRDLRHEIIDGMTNAVKEGLREK